MHDAEVDEDNAIRVRCGVISSIWAGQGHFDGLSCITCASPSHATIRSRRSNAKRIN